MHFIVCLPLVFALALANPVMTDTLCAAQPEPIAYATPDVSKSQVEIDFPTPISAASFGSPSSASLTKDKTKIEYDFPAPISAPPPVPVATPARISYAPPSRVEEPQIEYNFPAPISAPSPISYAIRQPGQIATPVPVQPVVPHTFETRVHYAETPVVVGQTAHIMKPNLGAGAHVTNFDFMGLAQTKTAGQESYAQTSKVLAPARSVSEITPQVAVQHPTKINVQKVAVEVPVVAPYAQPVPVPVAPQYEIHQYHQSRPYPGAFSPVRMANSEQFDRRRKQQSRKLTTNLEGRKIIKKTGTPLSTSYRSAHFLSAPEAPRYFHRLVPGNMFKNFFQLSESTEDRDSIETYDD
ncbi:calphotin-like [Daphnia carinata]|uniref:calphotin-like n=1 Tax=Daphnia carinata TaxID=120202 RepID=UPI00257ACDC9|nr:calphotin-like [Daphnia carinata]